MINDNEMLNYVLQSAEMGCNGITNVRRSLNNSKVDGILCEQLIKYSKLYHCANTMLRKRGASVQHISPMAKAMTRHTAHRELKRDSTSSHIAEMMIKGNTMGISRMAKHMRDYNGSDPYVTMLARKMLETEEESISELKEFL